MGSKREKRWGQCAYSCRSAYFHPAEDIEAVTLHNLPARIAQRHRANGRSHLRASVFWFGYGWRAPRELIRVI